MDTMNIQLTIAYLILCTVVKGGRKIVSEHDGKITLSNLPDRGALISIQLPLDRTD